MIKTKELFLIVVVTGYFSVSFAQIIQEKDKTEQFNELSGYPHVTLEDIAINQMSSSTDVTVTQKKGSKTPEIVGQIDSVLIDGSLQSNMTGNGAIYRFKGRVELSWAGFKNYIFEGDERNPLVFRCVAGKGFVYVRGKGRVIKKLSGKVIKLGYTNN